MLYLMWMLFVSSLAFTQELTNNQQYIDNPQLAILHTRDYFDKTEMMSLKPEAMNFINSQGKYRLDFLFHRDRSDFKANDQIELIFSICSSKIVVPFDHFEQKIELTITDQFYTYLWNKTFSFSKREVFLNINNKGNMELTLKKTINNKDFEEIKSLFVEDRMVFFAINGFYGKVTFAFPENVVNFYRQFFDYKAKIYNN